MIRLHIYPDRFAAARAVADEIAELLSSRAADGRGAVLGLAAGATPVPLYDELARRHRDEGLSFRRVTTFNLDEYAGLPADHPASFRSFMRRALFDRVDLAPGATHFPDGAAADPAAAASAYEHMIAAAGGIDLQVLGIGRTGHVGFNEPPAGPATRTRIVELLEQTRRDNAASFGTAADVPRQAVTMGVGTILDCRRVVLLAWGAEKAEVVRRAVEEPPSDALPASWLQTHPACDFVLDEAAAARLASRR